MNPDTQNTDFDIKDLPILYSISLYMTSIKENKPASDFLKQYPAEKIYEICFRNKTNA